MGDLTPDQVEQLVSGLQREVKKLKAVLDIRHVRDNALHQARESWGPAVPGEEFNSHAEHVTKLAAAFAAFLTDGTVAGEQNADGGADEPSPYQPPPPPPGLPSLLTDWARVMRETPKVVEAAVRWVDAAHLQNTAGPNNWRNWADEKDVNLINAVLAYRGLEPIEP